MMIEKPTVEETRRAVVAQMLDLAVMVRVCEENTGLNFTDFVIESMPQVLDEVASKSEDDFTALVIDIVGLDEVIANEDGTDMLS